MSKDVHTEHCCAAHGCKYGDPMCPVAKQEKEQSYPCEQCAFEEEKDKKIRQLEDRLEKIKEAAIAYEKDPISAFDRASSWEKLATLVRLGSLDKI